MQGRLPIDAALNIVVLGTSEEIPSILAALQACRDNVVGPLNISTAQGSFEAVKQLQNAHRAQGHCHAIFMHHTFTAPRSEFDALLIKKQLRDVNKSTPIICWGDVRRGGTRGRHYHYGLDWPTSGGNVQQLCAMLHELKNGNMSSQYAKSREMVGLKIYARDTDEIEPQLTRGPMGVVLFPFMVGQSNLSGVRRPFFGGGSGTCNTATSSSGTSGSQQQQQQQQQRQQHVHGSTGTSKSKPKRLKFPKVPFWATEGTRMRVFLEAVQERREQEAAAASAGAQRMPRAHPPPPLRRRLPSPPASTVDSRQMSFDLAHYISTVTQPLADPAAARAAAAARSPLDAAAAAAAYLAASTGAAQRPAAPHARRSWSGLSGASSIMTSVAGDVAAFHGEDAPLGRVSVGAHLQAEAMAAMAASGGAVEREPAALDSLLLGEDPAAAMATALHVPIATGGNDGAGTAEALVHQSLEPAPTPLTRAAVLRADGTDAPDSPVSRHSAAATPGFRLQCQSAITAATLTRAAAALNAQLRGGAGGGDRQRSSVPDMAAGAAAAAAPAPGGRRAQILGLIEEVRRLQALVDAKRARDVELRQLLPQGESVVPDDEPDTDVCGRGGIKSVQGACSEVKGDGNSVGDACAERNGNSVEGTCGEGGKESAKAWQAEPEDVRGQGRKSSPPPAVVTPDPE